MSQYGTRRFMKIKELFVDRSRWTKNTNARNTCGEPCVPNSYDAICWCLIGATYKCYPPEKVNAIISTLQDSLNKEYSGEIVSFNDAPETAFEQVKALVERLDI